MSLLRGLLLLAVGTAVFAADDDRGFAPKYDWVPHPEAVATATATGKPIMYLVHKTWCGAHLANETARLSTQKRAQVPTSLQVPASH